MKNFEIYKHLDDEGEETILRGYGKDEEYHLDDISANSDNEAIVIAYEEYGECVIRWCRKNGYQGWRDIHVEEKGYNKAKEKLNKKQGE